MKSIILSSLFFSIISTSIYAAGAAGAIGSPTGSQYQSDYTNPYNYPSSSYYYNSEIGNQESPGMPQGYYYNPNPARPWMNNPRNVETNPNYQTNPNYLDNPTYPETQPYYYYQGSHTYPQGNPATQEHQQSTLLNSKTSFANPGMNSSSYGYSDRQQRRSGIDSPSQQYDQNYFYQGQGNQGYYYQNPNVQQGYYPEYNSNRQDFEDHKTRSYYRSLKND